MGCARDQIISIFKAKDYSQTKCLKTVHRRGKKPSKLKTQKQSEDDTIKSIRNI